MTRRFLAATATLAVLFGFSGPLRAQNDDSAAKEKGASQSAGTTEKSPTAEDAAPAGAKSGEKPAASKSKASASKTKTKKGSAGTNSTLSTSSGASEPKYELATFGAGCFWHVEADFERLNGVVSAVSGYAGGNVRNPNYEMVHEGYTGHAEVVMVQYDPEIISYEGLLKVFWTCHNPTTPNQQGPDVGPQYRSIILYHNEAQRKAALKSYQQLVDARAFSRPIVTQLFPLKAFYRAEDEHQDYYGGKPRATTRRRATSTAKSKKPQSKVARALSVQPAADADDTKPADDPSKEAKPAVDPPVEKKPESQP